MVGGGKNTEHQHEGFGAVVISGPGVPPEAGSSSNPLCKRANPTDGEKSAGRHIATVELRQNEVEETMKYLIGYCLHTFPGTTG